MTTGGRLRSAVAVLLWAAPAHASVSGRVTSDGVAPVAGATVRVYAPEASDARAERLVAGRPRTALATMRTDAAGAFRAEDVQPPVEIEVQADGYAPSFGFGLAAEAPVLALQRAPLRRGSVRAGDGPVAHATLVWTAREIAAGPAGELVVTTDADGGYEVPDPDAWAAHLTVLHPGFAVLDAYPEASRWPAVLELKPGVAVAGRVVDEHERPVAGAALWLGGWPLGTASEAGEFRLGHVDASWTSVVARTARLAGEATIGADPLVVRAKAARAVSGVVHDARTAVPVAGAVVTVRSASGVTWAATTDGTGRYALSVEPGRYTIDASRADYVAWSWRRPEAEVRVDLRVAPSAQRILALERRRRVAGRVQDESRRPVAGARVLLCAPGMPTVYGGGDLGGMARGSGFTNADGSFAVLAPDTTTSAASARLDLPLVVLKDGFAVGRVELAAAAPGGDAPVVVTLVHGLEIKGRVVDATGAPVAGVAVVAAEDALVRGGQLPAPLALLSYRGDPWTSTGADGRFSIRVRPGVMHDFALRKDGYVATVAPPFDPASGEPFEATLLQTTSIRGHVVRTDGSPLAGARLETQGLDDTTASAVAQADGAFSLDGLAPGSYAVTVSREGTALHETRKVDAPAADLRIEIAGGVVVRGHVLDAKTHAPIARYTASLDVQSQESYESEVAVDDAGGAFAIADAPAADLQLIVHAAGYVPQTVDVPASDGEPPELEVLLEPGATLRGRVTTTAGQPLADANVTATPNADEAAAETDENGEYALAPIEPGPVVVEFSHTGFVTERKSVTAADTTRVDATLSRGLALRGVVLSDGAGVPQASVLASGPGDASQFATSNADGGFEIAGLTPGHYRVSASADDAGTAQIDDVDVQKAGPLRLVLERKPTAAVSGVVTGLGASTGVRAVMVFVKSDDGGESAPADAAGAFRVEKAPVGRVRVQAYASTPQGDTLASKSVELTLAAGAEASVTLEFAGDIVVAGVVVRDGAPVAGVTVAFQRTDAAGADLPAAARTANGGRYETALPEPGRYRISVSGESTEYTTEADVSASMQIDLDVTGASLSGRVTDATSGAPLTGAEITLWLAGAESAPASTLTTNARGEYAGASLHEGRYRIVTSLAGYGQQTRDVDLGRGDRAGADFELTPAAGVGVKIVDARDGRTLDATVVVRDPATRRIVANRHSDAAPDGTVTVALADGAYLLSASSTGYATTTMPVTSPASGLRLGLTPGGTLVATSTRDLHGTLRLRLPDGDEYVRCWCNGLADIPLTGHTTTVPNVAPGRYTIELLAEGAPRAGPTVSIEEGQIARVSLE